MSKPTKPAPTFPVPGKLGMLLNAGHLRVELAITRADGSPPDTGDLAEVRATLDVWALREAKVDDLIERAAKLLPANRTPSNALRAAVVEGGGLRPTPSRAAASKAKPRAKRVAAKASTGRTAGRLLRRRG